MRGQGGQEQSRHLPVPATATRRTSTRRGSTTHARKVACQTCHIPAFARGGVRHQDVLGLVHRPARWTPKASRSIKKDAKGHIIYDAKKGDFVLAENVGPEYVWFNGTVNYTLLGDKIDKSDGVTPINRFGAARTTASRMIWPVKVLRGVQPYDPVNKTLVTPHTAGNDDTAYWKNFGWEKAIAAGMATTGRAVLRQGRFHQDRNVPGPSPTWWRRRRRRCDCDECHSQNGRLAEASPGVYMPGRDA